MRLKPQSKGVRVVTAMLAMLLGACSQEGTDSAAGNDTAASTSAATCDGQAIQAMAPADTTITSARLAAEPAAHCRVDGYVTTTDPGPNRNNFRLQLPDEDLWEGRYYFIGMELLRRDRQKDAIGYWKQATKSKLPKLSAYRGAVFALKNSGVEVR